jgi:ribosome-associated heat shock protein Hsp15
MPKTTEPKILDTLRIDKVLWHLRLAKSRSVAQAIIEQGYIRINQCRVERTSQIVCPGDVITMMRAGSAIAIRVTQLPAQRLSAENVQKFCALLD